MKNVWKPGKWMNSLHFFWGLTKIGFNLYQYISSTFSNSKMFFRFVQNMTVEIVFKIIPLAFWGLNVENKCQISLRWNSVVSPMIRSPSKWSKFHEFRLREFVYFSVRNHSVGDWRGDKSQNKNSRITRNDRSHEFCRDDHRLTMDLFYSCANLNGD